MNRFRFAKKTDPLLNKTFMALPLDKKLQLGGFLVSIVMGGFAIYQYGDTKKEEFKKVFYEERFRTYSELSENVAKLATLPPQSKERAAAVQRYWQLVFGKAHLVGDAEVQDALLETSKWVVFCIEKKAPPPEKHLCIDAAGNAHAMGVSSAARNSIIRTWHIPLDNLNSSDLYLKMHE
ncbi:hypothetical protein [Vogesella indigofera]|uniref:hypothetical protein n=1 Tax=Vogesella indigofera TaxID=45465 RepID=UPI00234D8662|nr:hypothetical protein [Vogesella indigofera]MDC7704049.1 hypothetical protein [Vogesella indigofera]